MPAGQINPLDEIRLLSRVEVAEALGVAAETLDDWVRKRSFPPPLQGVRGGPRKWRFAVVRAWVEKRARARYSAPSPRGALKRGTTLTIRRRKVAE
jgi:predicted DNA-binding transcriptional regulator AlpA